MKAPVFTGKDQLMKQLTSASDLTPSFAAIDIHDLRIILPVLYRRRAG